MTRGCTCRGPVLCPQCQRLADLAGVANAVTLPPVVSEKAFMAAVIRVAKEHGWLVWHAYNSRKSLPGYPDLTLAKAGRPVLFSELKVPGGALTLQQHAWLEALTLAEGKEVHCWTPEQWPLIVAALRR